MKIDHIMWEVYIHYFLGFNLEDSIGWEETSRDTRLYLHKHYNYERKV